MIQNFAEALPLSRLARKNAFKDNLGIYAIHSGAIAQIQH
jgi:hypothetical protein